MKDLIGIFSHFLFGKIIFVDVRSLENFGQGKDVCNDFGLELIHWILELLTISEI